MTNEILSMMPIPTDGTDISTTRKSKCPHCNGKGVIFYTIPGDDPRLPCVLPYDPVYVRDCEYCTATKDRLASDYRKRTGIPQSFRNSTMKDFKWDIYTYASGQKASMDKQKTFVFNLLDHFRDWEKAGQGLYIWSNAKGSGKTFLSACICNELIDRYGIQTRFVSTGALLDLASKDNKADTDYIRQIKEARLLVLDDLGQKMTGGEWLEDILFNIIDERMTSKRVTIITSNIEIPKLRLNDRITDRIYNICRPLSIPEVRIRIQKGNADISEFLKKQGLNVFT